MCAPPSWRSGLCCYSPVQSNGSGNGARLGHSSSSSILKGIRLWCKGKPGYIYSIVDWNHEPISECLHPSFLHTFASLNSGKMDPSGAHTACTSDIIIKSTRSCSIEAPDVMTKPEQQPSPRDGSRVESSEEELQEQELLLKARDNQGFRKLIRNFTPS